jgi:hypothetical protein
MATSSSKAATQLKEAAKAQQLAGPDDGSYDNSTLSYNREKAKSLRQGASDLLALAEPRDCTLGREILPIEADRAEMEGAGDPVGVVRDTLANPDQVAVDASIQRIDYMLDAGILETGIDAAESIQAGDSTEKMLAHQMAAAHHMAMKFMVRSLEQSEPVEQARLANVSARFMRAYQEGLLTLHKIRRGGKQTVVVQHVNVSEGGQAVVAGQMGGTSDGGGSRK